VAYTDAEKQTAIDLAERTNLKQAAEGTGISAGRIGKWLRDERRSRRTTKAVGRAQESVRSSAPKIAEITTAAVIEQEVRRIVAANTDEIEAQVKRALAHTMESITADLLELVGDTVREIQRMVDEGPADKGSRPEWLKAIVSALKAAVEQRNLLLGKPTGISEHNENVNVHGTLDARVAHFEAVYERLSDREQDGVSVEVGALRSGDDSDDTGESVDLDNA
jgi:hypothetical protein